MFVYSITYFFSKKDGDDGKKVTHHNTVNVVARNGGEAWSKVYRRKDTPDAANLFEAKVIATIDF